MVNPMPDADRKPAPETKRQCVQWFRFVSLIIVLGVFLCCGKRPTKPDNRPWYMAFDQASTWSPDGKQIAYSSAGNSTQTVEDGLYIVDLATRQRSFVLPGYGHLYHPHWSPDGEWIAISLFGSIYKVTPAGDSLIQLTNGGDEFSPRWSPNGQRIAYHVPFVPGGVFLIEGNSDSAIHIIDEAIYADWFPDEKNLALVTWDSAQQAQCARYNLSDSTLSYLASLKETVSAGYIRVSPDGTKVLYSAQEPTSPPRISLFTVDVNTRRAKKIRQGAQMGAWSPDGKYLAYTDCYDGAIYVWDLQVDTTVQVSPGILVFDPDWDSTGFPKIDPGSR